MIMSQQVSSTSRALSLTIAAHASLMFIGFFGLVAVFDFPDILREPPPVILETFRRSRTLVQGFYAAFMWSQVAFVCVVLALRERFGEPTPLLRASTHLGVIAGLAQAIGFARWPFVVGSLADGYGEQPEATLTVLDASELCVGMTLGLGGAVGRS